MASRQCMLAMKLQDIEREKFDGSLAKRQIRQYFPLSKMVLYGNCNMHTTDRPDTPYHIYPQPLCQCYKLRVNTSLKKL